MKLTAKAPETLIGSDEFSFLEGLLSGSMLVLGSGTEVSFVSEITTVRTWWVYIFRLFRNA